VFSLKAATMKAMPLAILFSLITFLGCGSGTKTQSTAPVLSLASESESVTEVAYPDFVNWNKFPEKSYTKRRKVVSNANGEVIVTTKVWLESKTKDSVSVGSQITVQRPDTPIVENEADFFKFASTFRLPKGLKEEQFSLPSPKAKETGKAPIKIGEKEFEATIYEWIETFEAGPTTVKLWRSDDVPGRFLRQEMFTKSIDTTSVEEVTEVNLGQ